MSKREMLINDAPGEECRIAIVEDGKLEELYQERASAESHVGNIYKGRVAHIEPSIQAAFIDFGLGRNGFLHLSDLHPKYFGGTSKEDSERIGKKTPHRARPPIQNCLRRGQEILVQVLKEGIGTKGPTLTSYLSIPGRFLVVLPYMERLGVSRKVEDDEARRRMRNILDELNPPKDFGFIIRTAGIGRTKTDLKRDLAYLQRLWKAISQRMKNTRSVGELYTESDLVVRTIRDVYTTDIHRIIVDNPGAAKRAENFLAIASPRSGSKVLVYNDPIPLFHRYGLEQQIETINAREVPLAGGGSLVIDSTEALVAIDVNSGKSRESRDAETTAFKTNLEAVDEVSRQLRLRDLGGVVVIDLIDMRSAKSRREVEQRFRENLKRDRARTQVSSISQFGILEMTRQRMRPSLKKSIYMDCPGCQGAGHVKSPESVVLEVMRRLALVMHEEEVASAQLTISPDVAFHLLNLKRNQLVELEAHHGKHVTVRVGGTSIDYIELIGHDANGGEVLPKRIKPIKETNFKTVEAFFQEHPSLGHTAGDGDVQEDVQATDDESKPRRRKRRRRGGRARKISSVDVGESSPKSPIEDRDTGDATEPSRVIPSGIQGGSKTENGAVEKSDQQQSTESSRPRRRRRRSGYKKTQTKPLEEPVGEKLPVKNEKKDDQYVSNHVTTRSRKKRRSRSTQSQKTSDTNKTADAPSIEAAPVAAGQ